MHASGASDIEQNSHEDSLRWGRLFETTPAEPRRHPTVSVTLLCRRDHSRFGRAHFVVRFAFQADSVP